MRAEENATPFPIDAFPPIVADYVRQIAEARTAPVELPAMTAVSAFGAAAGKKFEATGASPHGPCRANLYVLAVCGTSHGKTSTRGPMDPLEAYDAKLVDDYVRNVLPYAKARKDELEKAIGAKGSTTEQRAEAYAELDALPMTPPQIVIGDPTGEALGVRLGENCETLLSYSTEAGNAVQTIVGQYKKAGGDFSIFNAGWSGDSCRVDRITRQAVRLQSPCLSLCWSLQPPYFQLLLGDSESTLSGFVPRCLCFDVPPAYPHDDGVHRSVDPELKRRYDDRLEQILAIRFDKNIDAVEIPCRTDAREVFRGFHNNAQNYREAHPETAALMGKARENAIRVALVFAIMDDAREITAEHAMNACRLVQWCLTRTRALCRRADAERLESEARRLAEVLGRPEYQGAATVRDLHRRNGWNVEDIERLAKAFPVRFVVEEKPSTDKGGRPSRRVRFRMDSDGLPACETCATDKTLTEGEVSQVTQVTQAGSVQKTHCLPDDDRRQDELDAMNERVAIMEYDGGMTRAEAEAALDDLPDLDDFEPLPDVEEVTAW